MKYQPNAAPPAKSKMFTRGAPGSGKMSTPRFLGAPVNFCKVKLVLIAQ